MRYAELDQTNTVVNVFEVNTEVFPTDADVIAAFTNKSLPEGHYIINASQTNEADFDSVYDTKTKVFKPAKPEDHPSWIWDEITMLWIAPVPKPEEIPAIARNFTDADDPDADSAISECWGWDWNEELVAWECLNHAYVESEEVAAVIEEIEASIPKVS